jgi:hypothetical protein
MGALDAIRARLAAQKAAESNGASIPPASSEATQATTASSEVEAQPSSTAGQSAPANLQATTSEATSSSGPDPLAGLTGIQLLLARKKLAESKGSTLAALANRSSGSHSGATSGTTSSVATQVAQVQLGQAVLTPAQRAMDEAKKMLQTKEGIGFYTIDPSNVKHLPEELPASVVEEKLRDLDAALVLKTPDLARLTIEINRNLRQYDELAYLLKDEQLGLIVQANLTIKNTELITTKTKSASAATRNEKLAAVLTADDI